MAELPGAAATNLCTWSRKCFIARQMLVWLYLRKRPQHLVRSKSPMSIPISSPSSLKRSLIRAPGAVSAPAKLRSIWGYQAQSQADRVMLYDKTVMMKPLPRCPSSHAISCSLGPSISLSLWSETSLWNKACHPYTSWLNLQSYQWNSFQFLQFPSISLWLQWCFQSQMPRS